MQTAVTGRTTCRRRSTHRMNILSKTTSRQLSCLAPGKPTSIHRQTQCRSRSDEKSNSSGQESRNSSSSFHRETPNKPHEGRGSACLVRLWSLEPLRRYPYHHSLSRLSRRLAARSAVIMVSRGGTYSATVNKYQRSFPRDAAVSQSLPSSCSSS
jgi:hypothetical protein